MDDLRDTRGYRRSNNNQPRRSNPHSGSGHRKRRLTEQQQAKVEVLYDTLRRFTSILIPEAEKWDYDGVENHQLLLTNLHPLNVVFTESGTIDCVLKLRQRGCEGKIAVLNFASHKHPGGGARVGANAQEEDICRCSNLLISLEHAHRSRRYPIELDEAFYTPGIIIIKNEKYEPVTSAKVDIITSAAVRVASFNQSQYSHSIN